jgi:uncharacterized membrane protein (DUF373 family)
MIPIRNAVPTRYPPIVTWAAAESNTCRYRGRRGAHWDATRGHDRMLRRVTMWINQELGGARTRWEPLSFYAKFEQVVVLLLTFIIAMMVGFAVWKLVLKFVVAIVASGFDPTDYSVFQALFGMIFTVIIALEFKRSLLVVAERRHSVVQVRTVILIALLAIVRKLLILDLSTTSAAQLFALATSVVALGGVSWLVRDQDRREEV